MLNAVRFKSLQFRIALTLIAIASAALTSCGHGAGSSVLPSSSGASVAGGSIRQTAALGAPALQINVGGGASGTFVADRNGSGGTATSVTDTINTTAANAAPAAIYQTQRFGPMTYTIPSLAAGAAYVVRLHFAETWFGLGGRPGTGQRQFNVAVNGSPALTNFDVYAVAGAADTAVVRDVATTATSAGQVIIALTNGAADNAMLNGIEILPGTAPAATTTAINIGGPATGTFAADVDGVGGTTSSVSNAIDVTAANAAPMAVYQTQRYGPMTYTIPGFTAGGQYTVRMHFAEIYWGVNGHAGGAGSRKFNIAVNGTIVATNLDVFAKAGGGKKALIVDAPVNADTNGQFKIVLTNGAADNAMISGIEIIGATTAAPATAPPAASATTLAVNVGGATVDYFAADTAASGGSNGNTSSTSVLINVSAANAAPMPVYQSQRWGPFQRSTAGLTPGASYTVRLHFAELYFGVGRPGAGQRQFNVAINGSQVLSNFDVYSAAGAANTAVVRDFTAQADTSGTIAIVLTNGAADNAMLSGYEIFSGSTPTVTYNSEKARSSDGFVDSVGVNVHLSNFNTLYANFNMVQSLLVNGGIRHVRDGIGGNNMNICNDNKSLAANGIHVMVIATPTVPDLTSWLNCIGSAAELIEGPNEYDLNGGSNWVSVLQNTISAMATASNLPVVAPSLASKEDFGALGPLSQVSYGNAHTYFAGRNPGTAGWGSSDAYGFYGSLPWNLGIASQVSGTKPAVVSEGGYSEQSDQYAVPPVTKARYTLRMLLNNWNAGAARTYLYELSDEGPTPFSHYGIVDGSGNPKPVYTAIAGLLKHLGDPGGTLTPAPLGYNLATADSVYHTLLQKRNGTYSLILWNEVSEWDQVANVPQSTSSQPVVLTFPKAPSAITQSTYADSGTLTTSSLASSAKITLTAGGWPTIIDITP